MGPRFPDLSKAYDDKWRVALKTALTGAGLRTHEGVYLGLLGPSFETPSEVQLYSSWNMQAVGMSTVWESIALNHSGARVAGLSLISNAACGLGDGLPLEHEKIVEACRLSAGRILAVLLDWLEKEIA
jgi:purine-nucleoside phosphorylase